MKDDSGYIPVDLLKRFMVDVFLGLGVPAEDAAVCRDVLIASDLRGIESHGVGRLKMYFDRIRAGIQKPVTGFEIVKETPSTAVVDGHHGMGHVIGVRSMRMAIEKARAVGFGSVAVRNSTHYGIAGYYPLMAIAENMIGFSTTNARPSVPPTFGVEPMLGTNPIAFGAPTDEPCPFLIDCATSITQRGKIELLDRAEKPTPEGWAVDGEGRPHTDTKVLLDDLVSGSASLLALGGAGERLGGHKGYGIATAFEILSASLQGGSYLQDLRGYDEAGNRIPYKLGHFFLAIDIGHFVPIDAFKKTTGDIIRRLRASRKAPGETRIWTAGEKEYEMERRRAREGVPANPNLQKNILVMRDTLGLNQYRFAFEQAGSG
ncbi:MAG: Ldh family oxidoreductase [Kiritimatiellae bacterium]|nr:Ldh family oxidoreductase [Kiritimatiellia bacterium]